jgi:error-prone DNA polymerase
MLHKTYGVPIFQEQAMRLAITAAGFSSEEANGLRRAMATFRNLGTIESFRDKLVGGMTARGYTQEFAERCFRQIEGFGSYGFPESHAQSFARLVYVSSWMKCHHPAVFTCALLNSQPMGFYAPAQLVRDCAEHGVEIRPVDIAHSPWDNRLEPAPGGALALRLGLRQITHFRPDWADTLVQARAQQPFRSAEDLARRARLPRRALHLLADADAMTSLGFDRRAALWEVRRTPAEELPLFAAAGAPELGVEPEITLTQLSLGEQVASDYQTMRLSLKGHPMALLRPVFEAERAVPCGALPTIKPGRRVRLAGVVLIRQRPGKGKAIFITLEDETGVANIVLWAREFERFRREVMASRLMLVEGEVERSPEGVTHVIARRIANRSDVLGQLSESLGESVDADSPSPRAGHPRNLRILPASRDFH